MADLPSPTNRESLWAVADGKTFNIGLTLRLLVNLYDNLEKPVSETMDWDWNLITNYKFTKRYAKENANGDSPFRIPLERAEGYHTSPSDYLSNCTISRYQLEDTLLLRSI